jgi:methylmalonyl-CoA carboxyltransferase small subunit
VRLRITLEGQSYEVDVEVLPEGAQPLDKEPEIYAIDEADLPPPPPDIRPEERICRSPIAGLVIAVNVSPGQEVRKDDPLAILEAMKMQVPIGAPLDGTVEDVQVAPGDAVLPGQVLCSLR